MARKSRSTAFVVKDKDKSSWNKVYDPSHRGYTRQPGKTRRPRPNRMTGYGRAWWK